MKNSRLITFSFLLILGIFLGSLLIGLSTSPVYAESLTIINQDSDTEETDCFLCHGQPDWEMTLPNGDILSMSIDSQIFSQSVHKDMECTECHEGYGSFPKDHPDVSATNKRAYMISYHDTCQKCHQEQFSQVSDSIHDALFLEGNLDTPLCADCHQPHSQVLIENKGQPSDSILSWQAQICADCHEEAFDEYLNSVHGQGLLAGDGQDMPDCVDCHDVHQICDPANSSFRKTSVDKCAGCHTNSEIMEKYGLETNVLDTYMVFHGTTITLLEEYDPDSLTNKPTCYDCHGIHEIGVTTPPTIEADISALTLYPDVEVVQAGPSLENVGITGLMIGILIGSLGALTINQLIKEHKQDTSNE